MGILKHVELKMPLHSPVVFIRTAIPKVSLFKVTHRGKQNFWKSLDVEIANTWCGKMRVRLGCMAIVTC